MGDNIRPTFPEIPWLISYIEAFCIELFTKQIDERRITPETISTHYLQFEHEFMEGYKDESPVSHKTIRYLLKWVYENQAVASDPTPIITALKFISPNLDEENLDERTMAAVCQMLILYNEGELPTVNANPNLLPYETGYDLKHNLVEGQIAWNRYDNIYYVRNEGAIVDLRTAIGLEISHIDGLTKALAAISPIEYLVEDPIDITTVGEDKTISLKYDETKFELNVDGKLTLKSELGTYLSTAIPQEFTSANLTGTQLLITHGLGTEEIDIILFDPTGTRIYPPWKTNGINGAIVDFNDIIDDTDGPHKYVISYWKNQSLGIYPDPTYALAIHPHSEFALGGHNHNSLYSFFDHEHFEYSVVGHYHTGLYEPTLTKGYLTINTAGKNAALTINSIKFYRYGNTVLVKMVITSTAVFLESGAGALVGIVPNVPPETWQFGGAISKVSSFESCAGYILTTGQIVIFCGKANETYIFNFSYPLS